MKKIDKLIQNIVKWYCSKRGITVTFQKTTYINPSAKLEIYGNGKVGL